MLSRQDDENILIMFSDNLHFWQTPTVLLSPVQPWEFFKIGNCGSPIETEAGWLVLSHGVGAMRKYCLGAFLLDLNDPTHVIGRLREPLLSQNESEREGYVPNVVYTCGALLHGRELIIPYAMSDSATSFGKRAAGGTAGRDGVRQARRAVAPTFKQSALKANLCHFRCEG